MRLISPKLLLALVMTAGCYSTKPVTLKPNPDPTTRPSQIEVTMRNGERHTVYRPEIRQDSLHGWTGELQSIAVGFALDEIAVARARTLDGDKTAAFTIGTSLMILTAAFMGFGLLLAAALD